MNFFINFSVDYIYKYEQDLDVRLNRVINQ